MGYRVGVDIGGCGAIRFVNLEHLRKRLLQPRAAGIGSQSALVQKQVLPGDRPGIGMIAKRARGNLYTCQLRDMQNTGLILDVREVVGTRDLLLMLAVHHRQLRKLQIPILLEGKIDRLRQRKRQRSIVLARGASPGNNQS